MELRVPIASGCCRIGTAVPHEGIAAGRIRVQPEDGSLQGIARCRIHLPDLHVTGINIYLIGHEGQVVEVQGGFVRDVRRCLCRGVDLCIEGDNRCAPRRCPKLCKSGCRHGNGPASAGISDCRLRKCIIRSGGQCNRRTVLLLRGYLQITGIIQAAVDSILYLVLRIGFIAADPVRDDIGDRPGMHLADAVGNLRNLLLSGIDDIHGLCFIRQIEVSRDLRTLLLHDLRDNQRMVHILGHIRNGKCHRHRTGAGQLPAVGISCCKAHCCGDACGLLCVRIVNRAGNRISRVWQESLIGQGIRHCCGSRFGGVHILRAARKYRRRGSRRRVRWNWFIRCID